MAERDERGHQLGRACDCQLGVLVASVELLTAALLDQRRGADRERRRTRGGGCRRYAGSGHGENRDAARERNDTSNRRSGPPLRHDYLIAAVGAAATAGGRSGSGAGSAARSCSSTR